MQTVNIHAAKTHLSRLVDAAAAGQEIIARAGRPVAKLVPLSSPVETTRRSLGTLAGRLQVPADFDEPLPVDLLRAFSGG